MSEQEFYPLEIAKGLYMQVSRIGYPDEGIRLTFLDDIPFNLHFEVQLSRKDVQILIERLQKKLETEKTLR